ncbi:hypothetical protein [Sporichthya brevicatena]|uniref:hypothetical protein n=1 Tax=Sporichthya brevicatena TaxID=171442 RepID=UPI0031E0C2F3
MRSFDAAPVVLGKSWRNGIALGVSMGAATTYSVGFVVQVWEESRVYGGVFMCMAALWVALAVSGLRSGRVWVQGDTMYMSRFLRRRLAVHRSDIADVRIRRAPFGLRPTMGRSVEIVMKDGRSVVLNELQVPDGKKAPAPNVEGLRDRLCDWLATADQDDVHRDRAT